MDKEWMQKMAHQCPPRHCPHPQMAGLRSAGSPWGHRDLQRSLSVAVYGWEYTRQTAARSTATAQPWPPPPMTMAACTP
ncbi:poly(p)/ATP NAD kinase [Histoplasma ohiense]|nr:poly(p)/ATP NAD kinase [Histoplasma ohiense (nom. inval.)]